MTTTCPKPPTRRQLDVLAWVRAFCDERGFSPTIREIKDGMRIASPNGVQCHLYALRKKGLLTWQDGASRTIRPTGDA